jgi:hypothetical protein
MGRSRTIYADQTDAGNFDFDGQDWGYSYYPTFLASDNQTPIGYEVESGSFTFGNNHQSLNFTQYVMWENGVMSFGNVTPAQIAFMNDYANHPTMAGFPGMYISAGYADLSVAEQNNPYYAAEISYGIVAFNPGPYGNYEGATATDVTRVSWFDANGFYDKQLLFTPTDFSIDNTNYDSMAGYSIGRVTLSGANAPIPTVITFQGDWVYYVRNDFVGDGVADILIENTAGTIALGEIGALKQENYTQVASLGPEWRFKGNGDFLDEGHVQFLVENTNGKVFLGDVQNGVATYTQISSLGPEWRFVGVGSFLGHARTDFLIENSAGAVDVGEVGSGQQVAYTQVASLGPEWKFVGAGDFLGLGHDQFLIENTSGAIVVGDREGNQTTYTRVGNLGPEWLFVETGNFLGDGKSDFLIENTLGAVFVGEVGSGGATSYTALGGLGAEWRFVGAGDYLGEGHDQYMIQNTNGALYTGDVSNGHAVYTVVGGLPAQWQFHN